MPATKTTRKTTAADAPTRVVVVAIDEDGQVSVLGSARGKALTEARADHIVNTLSGKLENTQVLALEVTPWTRFDEVDDEVDEDA